MPRPTLPREIVAALDLNNVPWNLAVCAALGLWLMAAPAVFGLDGRAADLDYLAGALIVTWAVIGFAEIVRPIRLANVPIGLTLGAATWFLAGAAGLSRWNDVAAGLAVALLSLPRGRIAGRFAGWNRYLI